MVNVGEGIGIREASEETSQSYGGAESEEPHLDGLDNVGRGSRPSRQ